MQSEIFQAFICYNFDDYYSLNPKIKNENIVKRFSEAVIHNQVITNTL